MVITVSVVVASGIVVLVLIRQRVQRILPAVAVGLFGYSLASTHLAPLINSTLADLAHLL